MSRTNKFESKTHGSSGRNGPVSGASGSSSGPPKKHPLFSRFRFSFMRRLSSHPGSRGVPSNKDSANGEHYTYASGIKSLGTFGTVEDFWAYYTHIVQPNDLPLSTDLYLFREGISPMWEDPANEKGGRWILRMKKGFASQAFEDLAMWFIGEQFEQDSLQINGLAVSIRLQEDVLVSMPFSFFFFFF